MELHYIASLSLLRLFKEPGVRQNIRQTLTLSSTGPKKPLRALDKGSGEPCTPHGHRQRVSGGRCEQGIKE